MKWYVYISWNGVGLGASFFLAIWQDNLWIMLPFFIALAAQAMELKARKAYDQKIGEIISEPVPVLKEPENLETHPPLPHMPVPPPPAPKTVSFEFDVDYHQKIDNMEDIWPDGDAPENPKLSDVIKTLKETFHDLDSMASDFSILDYADVTIIRHMDNGKSEVAHVNNYFNPNYGEATWE